MSEVEDKIQLGDYVGAYIAIRNQRDTLKRKFEAEDVGLKEELKKLYHGKQFGRTVTTKVT